MAPVLPPRTCWVLTEAGLTGLRNQATGLAQALGVSYVPKEIRKMVTGTNFLANVVPVTIFSLQKRGLLPPWPDLLITCGRQSVPASIAIRRASKNKTFTVHIENPLTDTRRFDVVIAPAHDNVRGDNVLATQGAVHHVTLEKLAAAAGHFRSLFASLPRPLISVLVGGKNKYQDFPENVCRDFAQKLSLAAQQSKGSVALTFSRRTGKDNEAVIRQELSKVPSYIWDGQGENPYLGLLGLADAVVVTSDSISMMSEACSTGKPVLIYELPNSGRRHKIFYDSLVLQGKARFFSGAVEIWPNTPLDETRRAADFVCQRYKARP